MKYKNPVGRPPYGWYTQRGERVPHPEQQNVLAKIAKMSAAGVTNGDIAMRLNMDGDHPPHWPFNKTWYETTVARYVRRMRDEK